MSLTAPTSSTPIQTGSTPSRSKLTAGQVAELFGVQVATVRRWADDGKLRCTRTLGGDRRFDAAYVQRMLDSA